MSRERDVAQPADMRSVRGRIDRWRATRLRRSPMPEALWTAAVALAETHGVYPTARALGVNYESLKRRAETARADGGGTEAPAFIELGQLGAASELVLELASADGARLTIRAPAGTLDVAAVACALWGGRA